MRECCFNGTCFNNFIDLSERIGDIKGDTLFEFLHESPSCHMISYVPKGCKWPEFLFDFWDFTSQNDFDDEYTILHCVSTIMDTLRFTVTGEYLIDIKENTMDMD